MIYILSYIRPLAVRPFKHPEREPTPRGYFRFSALHFNFPVNSRECS